MPKLDEEDWRKFKKDEVAFATMPKKLFDLLLKKVYAPTNPGQDENIDELMIYLARSEPRIQPTPQNL